MSTPPPEDPPSRQQRASKPPSSEEIMDDGWKSAAQTQRLLHELRVHQIELEMQNEELRVSRAEVEVGLKRYTDLYDFAPVGYLTLSAESEIRELNLPAAHLLGRERARLVGAQLRTFVSPATRGALNAWLAATFAQQERHPCDVVLLRDAQPPLAAQLEAQLSADEQSVRAVITDITERKAMAEELRQAQKMEVIGQLAGGVAHDFNNILAAMVLNLGMLRVAGTVAPAGCDALLDLEALAQRASNLTSQLLVFGRRQTMHPVRVDISDLLGRSFQMLERLLGDEIHCILRCPSGLFVDVDTTMIEQAIMNLSLNARDAMPSGGTLTLETSLVHFDAGSVRGSSQARFGDFVRLRISDTGAGMTPDVLQHAFEPFFTTKEVGKGSGLGLASVYGAIMQHSGWLNVESRKSEGTTFSIYLPHVEKKSSARASSVALPTTTTTRTTTVLLVEDERALRDVARRVLTSFGYRVLTAPDGHAALALWQTHANEVDLLLTDMRMPDGMSGLALAKSLFAAKPALKVVIMSGYGGEISGLGSDASFGFLPKPFTFEELAATLRRALTEGPAQA